MRKKSSRSVSVCVFRKVCVFIPFASTLSCSFCWMNSILGLADWLNCTKCPLKIFRWYGRIYAYRENIRFTVHMWNETLRYRPCCVCNSVFSFFLIPSFSLDSLFHVIFYIWFSVFSQILPIFFLQFFFISQLSYINVICHLCYWNQQRHIENDGHSENRYDLINGTNAQWVVQCQKLNCNSFSTIKSNWVLALLRMMENTKSR